MAGATNWLTFSLTPMETLRSSDSHFVPFDSTSSPSFLDTFYGSSKVNQNQVDNSVSETDILAGLMEMENENQQHSVPKVEDFFDTQTENQDDSSLTQIYFNDQQQDLKAIADFQAFSATNSGSELDDSACNKTRSLNPVESNKKTACLGDVANGSSDVKAIVAVEFDTPKKVAHAFGQRTSIYRGVTRHRWTGRYEAHLWDNSCRREGQVRKGRQVYLGGYDKEEKAARAYDLAALKYWGPSATTNFPVSDYAKELEEMKHAGKQEFIASLRRKSSGFSRGASIYRGVTRHHQQGRWQARIGRVAGNKDLYLGTFATEEEAAEAYDIAAIKFRGASAVTNFEMSRYDVETILNSSLPVGGGSAKRMKLSQESETKAPEPQSTTVINSSINFSDIQPVSSIPFDSATTYYPHNLFHQFYPLHGGSSSTAESAATLSTATTLTTPPPASPGFFMWPHQSY